MVQMVQANLENPQVRAAIWASSAQEAETKLGKKKYSNCLRKGGKEMD